jgi:hypothetical protein
MSRWGCPVHLCIISYSTTRQSRPLDAMKLAAGLRQMHTTQTICLGCIVAMRQSIIVPSPEQAAPMGGRVAQVVRACKGRAYCPKRAGRESPDLLACFAPLNMVRTRSTASLTSAGMNGTRWNASLPVPEGVQGQVAETGIFGISADSRGARGTVRNWI